MQIYLAKGRGFGANSYILTADNQTAIVIDPAHAGVANEVKQRGLICQYVLLTHCHFDHVAGVAALQETGAKVLIGELEKPLVGTSADLFERFGVPREDYSIDGVLKDGELRELCGMQVQTILTPGHTAGSVCYLMTDGGETVLFTGDTLFAGTIGRTDFPSGNIGELRKSLKKLYDLSGDYPVYPGHQEETTLDNERKTTAFMCDL